MTTLIAPGDVQGAFPGVSSNDAAAYAAKATAAAESFCGGPLALAPFAEIHTPGTTRIIRLKARYLVSLDRLVTDLSGALTIQAAGAPWRATVALQSSGAVGTGLTLCSVVAGVQDTQTIAFTPMSGPTIATVQDLATAIGHLGGWTSVIAPGMTSCPASELVSSSGAGAVSAYPRPAQLLAYATTLADYDLVARLGKITLRQIRPDPYVYPTRTFGIQGQGANVLAVGSAGFNGDPANGPVTTPADLAEGVLLIVRGMLDARKVSGIYRTVTLGNTSYTAGEVVAIPDSAAGFLSPYVDRRI